MHTQQGPGCSKLGTRHNVLWERAPHSQASRLLELLMGHSHCGVSSVGHRTPIATHCYGLAPVRMLMRKGGVWEREGASLITKISQASGRKITEGAGVILLHRSERFFRGRRCLGFLKNLGKVLTANREEMTGGKGRWLSPWKGEGGGAQLDAKL